MPKLDEANESRTSISGENLLEKNNNDGRTALHCASYRGKVWKLNLRDFKYCFMGIYRYLLKYIKNLQLLSIIFRVNTCYILITLFMNELISNFP